MKVWKCGIIGADMIADFHAKAILSQPNALLCACADSNFSKAQAFSAQYNCNAYGSYEEMLTVEHLDIVSQR